MTRARRLASLAALGRRALATAALLATFPTGALADPSPESVITALDRSSSVVRVETSDCPRLRSERIEQLLRLEVATLVPVVSELPTLDVDFACENDLVRITLRDPITVKLVTRDVSLAASADPERTLALAASELFLASWAELLIPRPQDKTAAPKPGVAAAKLAVERVVPARPTPPTIAIDVRAIGRERSISAPILTLGAALRVGHAACLKPQIFAEAGWEAGSVPRTSGRVDLSATSVGAGARWCLQSGPGELGLSASVAAMYISIQGVPSSPAFYGAHFDGFTAEGVAGVDASLTLKSVRLGAGILVGEVAPGPGGAVRGETTVRLDGAWVGGTLFAAFSF
jgi:hypothetical protein